MHNKEFYQKHLTSEDTKQIERVCGKDWDVMNIPAYLRNQIDEDARRGYKTIENGEFAPETKERLRQALEKTTGETIEDMGLEEELEDEVFAEEAERDKQSFFEATR